MLARYGPPKTITFFQSKVNKKNTSITKIAIHIAVEICVIMKMGSSIAYCSECNVNKMLWCNSYNGRENLAC